MSRDLRIPLSVLARWNETDALTLNEERQLAASTGNGELTEGQWVAEISHVEIITGTTAVAPADIQDVMLRLDGREVYPNIRINGRMDASTAPPMSPMRMLQQGRWQPHTYGVPIGVCPMLPGTTYRDPRFCTMPKYKRSVSLQYVARAAVNNGTTRQFVVYGYLYPANVVSEAIGNVGGSFALVDQLRGKSVSVDYPVKLASPDTWTQLPGGQGQGAPAIYPYLRDSVNLLATTPNTPYQFRETGGLVARANQELYWSFQVENKALWIQRLGVRATAATMRALMIQLADEEFPSRRGNGAAGRGWPAQREYNPLMHYGHAFPEAPQDSLTYLPIPLMDKSIVVHREIGQVNVLDNGTLVAIGGVRLAAAGVLVEGV